VYIDRTTGITGICDEPCDSFSKANIILSKNIGRFKWDGELKYSIFAVFLMLKFVEGKIKIIYKKKRNGHDCH